jgi:hypothetical protein
MKKFLYLLMLVSITCVTISSCTDEEVKPQTETNNAGGVPIKE